MRYEILNSNSDGNCIILEDIIMLDCGLSYAKIKHYLQHIKLVFISHIHTDHLQKSTIKHLAYNFPTIKFIVGSEDIVDILVSVGVKKNNIILLDSKHWFDLGMCKVKLVKLTHDVPNHGICIEYKDKKCLYVVDTANLDNIEAKGYDLYLVEANYKEELLEKHLQEEGVSIYLSRVPKTHLSYSQANDFLINNMSDNSYYEYIHKSNYNFEE